MKPDRHGRVGGKLGGVDDAGGEKEGEECFHHLEMLMFANHGTLKAAVGMCSTGWERLSQFK